MKFKQRSKGGYVYLGEERCKQKGGGGGGYSGPVRSKRKMLLEADPARPQRFFCFLL